MHIGYIHYIRFETRTLASKREKVGELEILISNSSDLPIYEQIVRQLKDAILRGELQDGAPLPSIRSLANDLRVSVITTKRAYAELERLGFINTVPGKGSFVAGGNLEMLREERLRTIERLLSQAVAESKAASLDIGDLHDILDALVEP